MRELSIREMGSIYGGEGGGSAGGSSGGGSSGSSDHGGSQNNGGSGGNGGINTEFLGTDPVGVPLVRILSTGEKKPTKWPTVFSGLTTAQCQAFAARNPAFSAEWNREGHPSRDNRGGGRGMGGGR